MAHDVFISYASADKAVAETVCEALEGGGVKCWIAPRNIVVGSYGAAIIKAIKNSKMMVLVLSSSANESEHVHREVERAADKGITIYPVRVEEVVPSEDLELFVSSEQWFDAFPTLSEEHLEQLTENVKLLLGQSVRDLPSRPPRSHWPVKLRHAIRPSYVAAAVGGVILFLLGWMWLKSGGEVVSINANSRNANTTPSPRADATSPPTPETATNVQRPSPTAAPTAVAPSPTVAAPPTPTPTPEVAERLEGTLWEYRHGSSVRYIWDFQPGGRFRSRHPGRGTYLPDGTWEQDGDTVIIRTSITTDNPETYRGKIRGDRMQGTFTGLDVYRWSAVKMNP